MPRRYIAKPTPGGSVTEAALEAMDAEGLRALIRELIPQLDQAPRARFVNGLVDRAARNASGWVPDGPTDQAVAEIVSFAKAATRAGRADPSEVDDYLRQGSNAFLAKDYRAAFQIFRALLLPLGNADIDLGQHEILDEVLGVDIAACAAQYVVSMYMTAAPRNRAQAVLTAVDEVRGVSHFWEPLRELERVVVESLPDFEAFLSDWRLLIEERARRARCSDWDSDEDRWLREVVQRTGGADGLAQVARSTQRAGDLRAWCRALTGAKDWKVALDAYEEAAEIVDDKTYSRGEFLDGAALAAQELGRKDLPAKLDRAWREAPSMVRLRRWLGAANTKTTLRKRVSAALETIHRDEPRLVTPEIAGLIAMADVAVPDNGTARAGMVAAMRKAAEKRIEGVTENKRRRHYEHAAALALTCARIDPEESTTWLANICSEYRQYPALQRELGTSPRR
ncbi:MAG: hypothetical protein ABI895_32560 [Deltaproteobacteria bacterium]